MLSCPHKISKRVVFLFFLLFFFFHISSVEAVTLSEVSYTLDRVIGQPNAKDTMTNLPTNLRGYHLGGVHVDSKGRIYVFDSANNRILGFLTYSLNRPADIVIGQSGFSASLSNTDNTKYLNPTASTLSLMPYPVVSSTLESPRQGQMSSDSSGNLYILDLNNNRVLKYNDPFSTDQVADEVWGQPDMVTRTPHCGVNGQSLNAMGICTEYPTQLSGTLSQVFMAGVQIDRSGNLWVTDTGNNRVLRYPISGGAISKTPDIVLGQSSFTTNTARLGFDTSLNTMQKPIALAVNPVSGSLYVMEGEFPGEARILVFTPPFTNGMSATFEMGRSSSQTNTPTDTTGWVNRAGRWVKTTSGLYFPRGMVFENNGLGLWVNDPGNDRILRFSNTGSLTDVIGQSSVSMNGCLGLSNQGFKGVDSAKYNACEPGGGMGMSSDGHLYVALNDNADPKSIVRFLTPISRDSNNLAISDGRLLHEGWNTYSGKTFYNGYGMSLANQNGISQLLVSDRQRILVWNNPESLPTNAQATYVIGQDTMDTNLSNNGGIFNGVELGPHAIGGGYLFVSSYDRIYAFTLPITGGGKSYPVAKTLFTGAYAEGNVSWLDGGKVSFRATGITYDPVDAALWVSDSDNRRVFRIKDPMTNPVVDIVLGQPSKSAISDNGGLNGPNAKGFLIPWYIAFDRQKNLYVVDGKWERGGNDRVVRYGYSKTRPISGKIFSFPDADGVYAKQSLTSSTDWGSGYPGTPSSISFDSTNKLYMTVDSYGNPQYQKLFVYPPTHATEAAPKPTNIIPIAFGQAAMTIPYPDDQHLWIQDHTWNRILAISFNGTPTSTPMPPTIPPTLTPTKIPTAVPMSPTPTPMVFSNLTALIRNYLGTNDTEYMMDGKANMMDGVFILKRL